MMVNKAKKTTTIGAYTEGLANYISNDRRAGTHRSNWTAFLYGEMAVEIQSCANIIGWSAPIGAVRKATNASSTTRPDI